MILKWYAPSLDLLIVTMALLAFYYLLLELRKYDSQNARKIDVRGNY